jgi:signal transduction histidine kinase
MWEAEVARLPEVRRLERPALRDHLPAFLVELGRCLQAEERDATPRFAVVASAHAVQRFEHGVDLRHVATEYSILRGVILGLFSKECDTAMDVEEVRCFNDAIDYAMVDAIERYSDERDDAREQFIGILGHDLRNPLSAIRMSASYLLEIERDEALRKALGRIESSADRIAKMIQILLDLARTRLGTGIPVTPAPASMDEIARAVVDELRAGLPHRDVALDARGDLRGAWDRDRATQAISNVLANALEHGEDPIRVVVREDDEDPTRVLVEITNAGEPIPQDAIPTLFAPFVGRRRAGGDGLGLGLFIACEILVAHGGSIRVRSSRESGTTFTLRWPRAIPEKIA